MHAEGALGRYISVRRQTYLETQMKRAVDGAATARHDELSTKQHGSEPSIGAAAARASAT